MLLVMFVPLVSQSGCSALLISTRHQVQVVNSANVGSGSLLVMLIQSLKRGDLAFEMVLSGIVTEHGERVGAAEGIALSHIPCV